MSGRVVVTGLNGFTGPYIRQCLETLGYEVCGLDCRSSNGGGEALNLLDADAVARRLAARPADYIIHLAAVSAVVDEQALDYYRVNVEGTLNLLEAIHRQGRPVRKVILASSANVYGRPRRNPVDEQAATLPVSHYGASKLGMELMARIWFERLPILLVRPFNYTGAGQSTRFVVAKLARLFAERAPVLELGDTSVVREFMDVRDVARVYTDLLQSDRASDVVNICSGVGHSVAAVLDMLKRISGHAPQLASLPSLRRANEIPTLVGSARKLTSLLGTLSFRSLEQTLAWMLQAPPVR